ncbi:MAG: radical SAM protein [Endomicrobiaceae bacterium]|nr:radical SAM protein [Endomicrobiaceae bacterium]
MIIEKELEIIRQYNRDGNFVMSKKMISKLLSDEKYKNNIAVILEAGQLLSGQLKFNDAIYYFKKALELEHFNIYALTGLCKCLIFLNKFSEIAKTIKIIKKILNNNKTEREKVFAYILKEIFYGKISKNELSARKEKECMKIIINNINDLKIKEKTAMVSQICFYYRQKAEFNKEEIFLKNIITFDSLNPEINKMYIDSLIARQKYRKAYQYIGLMKLDDKTNFTEYIVNNVIRINIGDNINFDELSIDSMLTCYFKLSKIKYLKKNVDFIQKLNSLLFKILVLIRQQNYKVKEEIYIKMLRQTDKKYLNIKNSILNEIEWNKKELILKSKPRVVQVMLTNECNSKCKMCSINKDRKGELTNTGFKNISAILKYSDSVTWQGGEVQFCKQFAELVQIARKYNVSQHVITNGINWDENLLKEIMQGDMNIAVSVDGFDADTYEYIRGIKGFYKVQEFMSMFNKHRTNQNRLKMYTTVMKINVGQLGNIPDFVNKNKIDEVVVSPLKKLVDNEFFYKENIFFENDGSTLVKYDEKIKKVNAIVDKLSNELSITKTKFVSYLPKICDNKPVKDGLVCKESCSEIENVFCQAPWKHISIIENGLVVPSYSCGQSLVFGDINSDNILKKWNSEQMQNIRKDIVNSCAKKWCGECKSVGC